MKPLPAGIILAGGQSRRLGRDKVALRLSGQSLLARTAGLLGKLCPEVYVSGRDPAELGLDLPWFADLCPGFGPLGGILSGLEELGKPCLALSCDLPLLDLETLRELLQAWQAKPAQAVMTVFRQIETGFIEALVAVYEPACAALLRAALRQGFPKLSKAVPPELRWHVDYSLDSRQAFFNLNHPEDLQRLREQSALEIG